ncbi:MAG: tetratricopeptide repeat protein [Desulfovibrio sp.]|uniref:tetratricopeptide repeat protein n=1 Tax=Desulfovibrio sp. TaxID=885 RepID=UPI0025C49FB5|nr:tetratricopeptide repeat protein [Desulfovibrio sp.]MBS6830761.1 tetratricopeptide repeat protein [Desulfovibrio sp.]
MNPQKNQGEETSPLFRDLQAEVSSESAPLLQFMLRHAGIIAGVVILFLLVLAGTGIWRWYSGGKNEDARQELARVSMTMQGQERLKALAALADKAPSDVRLSVLLAWAQSALESGDAAVAAEVYAKAAKLDADGALGMAAALGEAGSLLKAGKNAEALTLLQGLEARLPGENRSVQLRQMLAEAAARAGQKDLAAKTYQALAQEVSGLDGDYFRVRAEALVPAAGSAPEKPVQN